MSTSDAERHAHTGGASPRPGAPDPERGPAGAPDARDAPDAWGAENVRQLRGHLGESQAGLAARLGTRQQTVSEWETGASRPRRMSRRLLRLVAEESGYYGADRAGGRADDRTATAAHAAGADASAPARDERDAGAPPDAAP